MDSKRLIVSYVILIVISIFILFYVVRDSVYLSPAPLYTQSFNEGTSVSLGEINEDNIESSDALCNNGVGYFKTTNNVDTFRPSTGAALNPNIEPSLTRWVPQAGDKWPWVNILGLNVRTYVNAHENYDEILAATKLINELCAGKKYDSLVFTRTDAYSNWEKRQCIGCQKTISFNCYATSSRALIPFFPNSITLIMSADSQCSATPSHGD